VPHQARSRAITIRRSSLLALVDSDYGFVASLVGAVLCRESDGGTGSMLTAFGSRAELRELMLPVQSCVRLC
jgi:hypothetical protein